MALRGLAQSIEDKSLLRLATRTKAPATRPTFQLVTSCFAEGCHRCNDNPGLLHLIVVPVEVPWRRRR